MTTKTAPIQAYADTNGVPPDSTETKNRCPSWCTEETLDADHYCDLGYTPATGNPSQSQWNAASGYEFPSVGVALGQLNPDDAPVVSLHILGPSQDSDVYLTPAEARLIMRRMESALERLEKEPTG